MRKSKKVFSFFDVSIIVVVSSLIMFFLGASIIYKHLGGINYDLLKDDESLKKFVSAYDKLLDKYYDELDTEKLIEGAISGMYEVTGDPYTTYLDESSSNDLDSALDGKYTGIGVTIAVDKENGIYFSEVYKDTPASEVGIKAGDVLFKINDTEINTDNVMDQIDILKTNKESSVTVLRGAEELVFKVTPREILKPAVTSKMLDYNGYRVGYMKLSTFNDTADIQFTNELNDLENQGMAALIIDLRNNTGGYLQIAQNIAEEFIAKNKIIYSLKYKEKTDVYRDQTNEKRDYKIAVLINKGSASASEVLAAALKYSQGAVLVGKTSYGKGKVQERSILSNGTELKYTIAEWLTPNGDCIDGKGLVPDYDIELVLDEEYDPDNIYTDTQVMKALENLVG